MKTKVVLTITPEELGDMIRAYADLSFKAGDHTSYMTYPDVGTKVVVLSKNQDGDIELGWED